MNVLTVSCVRLCLVMSNFWFGHLLCMYVQLSNIILSSYLINEIELIEKVQRRFTKRLRGFNNLSYGSRLARLGLCTIELRRLHFDLIFCYKIVF